MLFGETQLSLFLFGSPVPLVNKGIPSFPNKHAGKLNRQLLLKARDQIDGRFQNFFPSSPFEIAGAGMERVGEGGSNISRRGKGKLVFLPSRDVGRQSGYKVHRDLGMPALLKCRLLLLSREEQTHLDKSKILIIINSN